MSYNLAKCLIFSSLLYSLLFLFINAAFCSLLTFTIRNQCPYTVWAAAKPGGGRRLDGNQTWVLNVAVDTAGARIWGRTNCSFNASGAGNCQTGDCGGLLNCSGFGTPPNTLAEYTLNQFGNTDFYDISLVDGFNIPLGFGPVSDQSYNCSQLLCTADINGECPSELRAPGGCQNPCSVYKTSQYCCTNGTCEPTSLSRFFKDRCPTSYSYPQDDSTSTFSCLGATNYRVVFCPGSSFTSAPSPGSSFIPAASPESPFIPAPSNKKKHTTILVSSVVAAGLLLLVLAATFFYFWRKKQQNGEMKDGLELPLFDLDTIACATNNFSITNKLGQGGYGPVYKGRLKDGQEIAVKTLSKNSRQGHDEFKNEVMHIVKLQHRNLVKILGCCIQGDERMLVYEFMPNKSLDYFIFDPARSKEVDWPKRYQIINGIARGLLYLHQDSRLRIIHRDLKLSNILLDQEMNPKISDFGLARSFGGNETEVNTNKVAGTYGYIAPEYAIDGLYSVKSDVFSFGVMVLEIVSENKNRGYRHPDHSLNLLGHAWRLFNEGRSQELIAGSLLDSCKLSEALRSIHVGLLCVQCLPKDRPSMSSVVFMFASEGELPQPKQPGFFTERGLEEAGSSSSHNKSCSVNELTITLPGPR